MSEFAEVGDQGARWARKSACGRRWRSRTLPLRRALGQLELGSGAVRARAFADKVARRRVDVRCVVTVEVAADGAVRAITRAITPGQWGVVMVTSGRSTEGTAVRQRDKTAGHP